VTFSQNVTGKKGISMIVQYRHTESNHYPADDRPKTTASPLGLWHIDNTPQSHIELVRMGYVLPLGGGNFLCGKCGVVGQPLFHNDMSETFIISSTCRHVWGLWSVIEAALDRRARS
jgi:hypothetical protein